MTGWEEGCMSFYTLFCEHYDELFPAAAGDMRWLDARFAGRQTLLDIGCGTGNKTVLIAGDRKQVVGIDADAGMIELARKHHAAPNINYLVMHMDEVPGNIPPDNFDAVACLGNTLPHLTGEGELFRAVLVIRRTMKRDGLFIGQLLNYDRIVSMNITSLPVIETDSVVFRRGYDWREGVMHFRVELEEKKSGVVQSDSVPLLPITRGWFEEILHEAGFGPVEYFGALDGQPYSEQSYNLVFTAALQQD